jgi:hypothetical protein
MLKQTVPHIGQDKFNIKKLQELFADGKIFINPEYQRSKDTWSQKQRVELIESIYNCYSIGVFVLYKNDKSQYEILDGQQRIRTIIKYIEDGINLSGTQLPYYSELEEADRTSFDSYCLYYLELTNNDAEDKEENIVQTFLRLQEGTPLNKAELLNAQRGKFKDAFRNIREKSEIFNHIGKERRFRFRQLAAELLMLELKTDFDNLIFPDLNKKSMLKVVKEYKSTLPESKVAKCENNLDFLYNSLNYLVTAFKPGEVISFYLLLSYLRKKMADKSRLINEFSEFATEFLKNLSSFSMYVKELPPGMDEKLHDTYQQYKEQSKIMTSASSLKERFKIMYAEYNRLHPIIIADPQRLHDAEQKRTLFFTQKGLCRYCGKSMDFRKSSGHHIIAHSKGGKTADLKKAALLHVRCHQKLEKQISKGIQPKLIDI